MLSRTNHMEDILLTGEKIDLEMIATERFDTLTNEQLDLKYVKGEVRIVTEQARYPLNSIKGMVEGGEYRLNPEFQRRHRWSQSKKSRLIESFIMNVPVPPIFLYEYEFSKYEVMDGLQRMSAIKDFYEDRFELCDLVEWAELNGRRYSTLPEQVRRGVDRRYLSSIVLLQETAKTELEARRLKQLVFERINSGGVQLEPQEARNAIFPGPLNDMCIRAAKTPSLCRTWGIPEPTTEEMEGGPPSEERVENPLFSRMQDVELVLRFVAYRQRLSNQRGSLKDYFDRFVQIGNLWPQELLSELESLFVNSITLAEELFGEQAFYLWRARKNSKEGGTWYQRPTVVVYDPLMYELSKRLHHRTRLLDCRDALQEGLRAFYEENYNEFEGRYTNLKNIESRNGLFGAFLDQYTR